MAANVNFGTNLLGALGSALDRGERAATRAIQVQQQIEERDLQRQIEQARQQYRQNQLNLQAERINNEVAFNLASLQQQANQNARAFQQQQTENELAKERNRLMGRRVDIEEDAQDRLMKVAKANIGLTNQNTKLLEEKLRQLKENFNNKDGQTLETMSLGELADFSETLKGWVQTARNNKLAAQGTKDEAIGWGINPDEQLVAEADSTIKASDQLMKNINTTLQGVLGEVQRRTGGAGGSSNNSPKLPDELKGLSSASEIPDNYVQTYAKNRNLSTEEARNRLWIGIQEMENQGNN